MNTDNVKSKIEKMKANVEPWHQALSNPVKAQEMALERLLKGYNQTEYGRKHHSEKVGSYADFQKAFPVSTFADFKPYLDDVKTGNIHALLSDEPVAMMFTKGTTGQPKFVPLIPLQIQFVNEMMLRINQNYSLYKNDFEWMSGYNLNIMSSAKLGTIKVGEREITYGYSQAVLMSLLDQTDDLAHNVTPTNEEMAALPKEPTKENWEKRYELVYQKSRDKKVTNISTSPNVTVGFGRYLHKKHHVDPKDLWQIKNMALGGYPSLQTHYVPIIHDLYGKAVDVRELYVGTEGSYGIQLDDKKAWSPLYDHLFFEVQTIGGIKPLHEMYPGEMGVLIVSTVILPRYRLGDMILAYEAPYFRCLGRENTKLNPFSYGKLVGRSAINLTRSTPLNTWR